MAERDQFKLTQKMEVCFPWPLDAQTPIKSKTGKHLFTSKNCHWRPSVRRHWLAIMTRGQSTVQQRLAVTIDNDYVEERFFNEKVGLSTGQTVPTQRANSRLRPKLAAPSRPYTRIDLSTLRLDSGSKAWAVGLTPKHVHVLPRPPTFPLVEPIPVT